MQIPCRELRVAMKSVLKKRVETLLTENNTVPTLATLLVGTSPEQESYVAIKEKTAASLGISLVFDRVPLERETLINRLHAHVANPAIHGMIVQQPLPAPLTDFPVYSIVTPAKDIEGHTDASSYLPPIGLAILTTLQWIITQKIDGSICFEPENINLIHPFVDTKSIVIAGKGITGGKPIASLFDHFSIPYTLVSSETPNPDELYAHADIIITAVGKTIIHRNNIKNGVILLNVGLHEENGKLVGDYDEDEIKDRAAWYSPTPGGIGPLDVLYLYHNLILAASHS